MTLQSLVLLRHGQTDWNLIWRMQGHTDIALNSVGRRQVSAAARTVAALGPDLIIASDLSRAQATARPVAQLLGLPVGTDVRLRETMLGEWEGQTRDQVEARWPAEWNAWRTTSADARPPGGESRWEVARRAAAVVNELDAGDSRTALLVTHGGLIVGLTGLLLELPRADWNRLVGVHNCHWVTLHRWDDSWRLQAYNAGLSGVVIPGHGEEVAGT